jgi:hypothetical protein
VIVYSHANGIHTAREPDQHPAVPGRLLASAMTGADGWYVSNRRGGLHLIFVESEPAAVRLLEVVAEAVR